jgi:UDP-N-acetylmuramoyl-L-alanyl-D-glutamate--2,6-diaminopimelate ligase
VFTNLTQDHLDAHLSPEHYFASKAQLFAHLPPNGLAVLNACDEVAPLLQEIVPQGVRVVTYGVLSRGQPELPLTISAENVRVSLDGTQAQLQSPEFGLHDAELRTTGIGAIYVENALAALAPALALGVDAKVALSVLATATPPEGRFEVIHRAPVVVIDYAHTPDALNRTLQTARSLSRGKVWVVFGAGGHRDRAKRPLLGQAAEMADQIVLTSDNPRDEDPDDIAEAIRAGIKDASRATFIRDRRRAIGFALSHCNKEDLVLIAGKGHERAQTDSSGSRPFSDRSVALELLEELKLRA